MSVDAFIDRFGGWTEEYKFYGGNITLRYNKKEHVYYLVKGNELEPQDGVTTVVHIIDKSEALIPWAVKMMAGKLLQKAPVMELPTGERIIPQMTYEEYENLVLEGKTAHKEGLEEAGEVGHSAHAWIEEYIKSLISKDEDRTDYLVANFPEDPRAKNCCIAALDWMDKHNVRWLGTEQKIYSRTYKYAGTMDGLCHADSCNDAKCCPNPFKDRLTIADWKTSNYLYTEYLLQTAAYMYAFNEESLATFALTGDKSHDLTVTDRWIIRLGKDDAQFDPWHAGSENFDQDFYTFYLALMLKRSYEGVKDRVKLKEKAKKDTEREEKRAAKEAAIQAEKDRKEQLRAEERAAKEAALKITCKNYPKYKGTRKPKCHNGVPCQSCATKYAETQAKKNGENEEIPIIECPVSDNGMREQSNTGTVDSTVTSYAA